VNCRDESEQLMIEDTEATIPEDWLVEEPLEIADPEAQKPADWFVFALFATHRNNLKSSFFSIKER